VTPDTDVLLARDVLTVGVLPKRRDPWMVGALGLATIGLYWVFWVWQVNRELRRFDERIAARPALSAAAVSVGAPLAIPQFLSIYRIGRRVELAQRAAGIPATCDPVAGVLWWICFGVGVMYLQDELNRVVDRYGAPAGTEVFHFA
jgi:hypothetical protein